MPARLDGSSIMPSDRSTTACHVCGPDFLTIAVAPGSAPLARRDPACQGARSSQSPHRRPSTTPAWSKCSPPGGSGFHWTQPFFNARSNEGTVPLLTIASFRRVTGSSAAFRMCALTLASGIATLIRMVRGASVDDATEEHHLGLDGIRARDGGSQRALEPDQDSGLRGLHREPGPERAGLADKLDVDPVDVGELQIGADED